MEYITPILTTQRLILRPLSVEDTQEMFHHWAGDNKVTRYLTWPSHPDEEATKNFLLFRNKQYLNNEVLDWGIVLKNEDTLIGTITVVATDEDTRTMEIGYVIGQSWWHQGYTSEAFSRVITYLFEHYPWLNRIEASHDVNNPNSGKVMQKCGLQFEGILRQKGKNNCGIVDIAMYAILRKDYLPQNTP